MLRKLWNLIRGDSMYDMPIREGEEYIYAGEEPKGCKGHRYRVVRFVLDVPTYQRKVLVECLSGADKGVWFVVSPANFSSRYEAVDGLVERTVSSSSPPPPVIEKPVDMHGVRRIAGTKMKGSGA